MHGGPGDGGGVDVALAVRRLALPEEAVTTGEQVVPKARTRQVLPGTAPVADGGQFGIGAVHAHVYGVDWLMEKKSFFSGPMQKAGLRPPVSCCADEGLLCVNRRKLDAFGEKPHLAVDQPPSSLDFMHSAESVMSATVFDFFLKFLSPIIIREEHAWRSLRLAGAFVT